MNWLCKRCHLVFPWTRTGKETRPSECPECGYTELESLEY